ncbi:glycosyltransferase [Candidatus Woesearchaeota archaeon]|nr:glycosyltransferase [Candidatus Woesearchaeota archaeon]
MKNKEKNTFIIYLSTYPPRECGIATFTKDLITAMDKEFKPKYESKIAAMTNEQSKNLDYPKEVMFKINETVIKEYKNIAKEINNDDNIKLVNIQHEFGIYGGKYLNYLSAFLETITKPVVITLHSVVPNPPANIRYILQYLAEKTRSIIVMVDTAVEILVNDYGLNKEKIVVIPHGIHEVAYSPSIVPKTKLGYQDRLIIASFGLISGEKDYETIIKALPKVVKKFPNTLFQIIGATHPTTLKKKGEKYRDSLKKLINKLGVNDNVEFVNKYLDLDELLSYLRATDIFVSSGKKLTQIVSGTLAYAMGCGRPIVTIPFLHAKEAVTKDIGFLVDIGDSQGYANAIIKLFENPGLREEMGKNAYEKTRCMLWDNVAKSYMKEFSKYLS